MPLAMAFAVIVVSQATLGERAMRFHVGDLVAEAAVAKIACKSADLVGDEVLGGDPPRTSSPERSTRRPKPCRSRYPGCAPNAMTPRAFASSTVRRMMSASPA